MIYLSPQGPGFFLFFPVFQKESVKKEVVEFDLSISRLKSSGLEVRKVISHALDLKRMNES